MMLRNGKRLLFAALFLLAATVAFAGETSGKTWNTSEGMPDLSKLHFTETPSGLKYADVRMGEDFVQPGTGQTVEVQYTGWLMDGRKFDSSYDRKKPFAFRIGDGRVIRGWDEGVSLMELGAKRVLIIPPELGYGKAGSPHSNPPIPPNATLVFEIELLKIK